MTQKDLSGPSKRALHIYELSHMGQWPAVLDVLREMAADYYARMPRSDEDKTKYETSNYVSNTIREIIEKLDQEIEVGRRLSDDDYGGERDADETGYYRGRT